MAGHSFGGSTALKVGAVDKRAKCILTLDPFMLPLKKEITEGKLAFQKDQSLFILNSGSYNDYVKAMLGYENSEYLKKIWDQVVCEKSEDVIMANSHHFHQFDRVVLDPFSYQYADLLKGVMPETNSHLIYQCQIWLWLSFLHRAGIDNDTFNPATVEENIETMKPKYVQYVKKYDKKDN